MKPVRYRLDDIEHLLAERTHTSFLAQTGPMPRIMPEARYFSMPSTDVGSEVLRNRALNCWPISASTQR
jgi:hypothetical protein